MADRDSISPRIKNDLAGRRFGRWSVLRLGERVAGDGSRYWVCRCDCGTVKEVNRQSLVYAGTQSCGCLRLDRCRGGIAHNRTHNMSLSPEHGVWANMKRRCGSPTKHDYPRYGGRGIRVCQRWRDSFQAFFDDMGLRPSPRHTIDRIDNDGHYEPGNCRWATHAQQNRNYRRNVVIEIGGRTQVLFDWLAEIGMSPETYRSRVKRGMSPFDALTVPLDLTRSRRPTP